MSKERAKNNTAKGQLQQMVEMRDICGVEERKTVCTGVNIFVLSLPAA